METPAAGEPGWGLGRDGVGVGRGAGNHSWCAVGRPRAGSGRRRDPRKGGARTSQCSAAYVQSLALSCRRGKKKRELVEGK